MADNVQVTEGVGTAVHADEYTHATFGSGKTQLVKIALGAPGTGVDAIAGAGAVTTGTLRVTLASDDPAVVALQILDNVISGSEMQADVVTLPDINVESTVLASAARTATVSSSDLTNNYLRGGHIIMTSITSSPSVVPTIEGKDPISGTYYTILTGIAITATGITILKVYPGAAAAVNAIAADVLPKTWRVTMTHGDADSITYSVAFAGVR
jgi:hypothetical protein